MNHSSCHYYNHTIIIIMEFAHCPVHAATCAVTHPILCTALLSTAAQLVEKEEEGKLEGPQGEGGGGSVDKKKKKKKKHKHSSVEGGPHQLQPFRLKINLGQPPDCS